MESPVYLGDVQLSPRAEYARALKSELPVDAFEPAHSRLALIPVYWAVIAVATIAIAAAWIPWWLVPVASVVIAGSFAGLTFVAHEALHGGIVRGKRAQHVAGWFAFLPFVLSPRLWVAWHNRGHHAHTNLDDDPDAYPTIERYRASAATRWSVDMFSLGGRRWRGGLSLVLGFTVQSFDQLFKAAARGYLSRRQHRLAWAETALGIAIWAVVAAVVGFVPFLFVFVIPVLLGNVCVMAFILTNHSLSPRIAVNDPLVGSLSVTNSRIVGWVTLSFGLHVEHHLFPSMSSRHAHAVRALLQAHWPDRYQSMPLRDALARLHRTARTYKDATTLVDPRTGEEFPTLLPRNHALRIAA